MSPNPEPTQRTSERNAGKSLELVRLEEASRERADSPKQSSRGTLLLSFDPSATENTFRTNFSRASVHPSSSACCRKIVPSIIVRPSSGFERNFSDMRDSAPPTVGCGGGRRAAPLRGPNGAKFKLPGKFLPRSTLELRVPLRRDRRYPGSLTSDKPFRTRKKERRLLAIGLGSARWHLRAIRLQPSLHVSICIQGGPANLNQPCRVRPQRIDPV